VLSTVTATLRATYAEKGHIYALRVGYAIQPQAYFLAKMWHSRIRPSLLYPVLSPARRAHSSKPAATRDL